MLVEYNVFSGGKEVKCGSWQADLRGGTRERR